MASQGPVGLTPLVRRHKLLYPHARRLSGISQRRYKKGAGGSGVLQSVSSATTLRSLYTAQGGSEQRLLQLHGPAEPRAEPLVPCEENSCLFGAAAMQPHFKTSILPENRAGDALPPSSGQRSSRQTPAGSISKSVQTHTRNQKRQKLAG